MFKWWDVLPDNERQRWTLDPFVSVGPLSFGMSPDEVSQALSDVTAEPQRHTRGWSAAETVSRVGQGVYQKFGLKLYYRQERLAGVVVDAVDDRASRDPRALYGAQLHGRRRTRL
jgi:hypothetical protein